MLNVFAAFSAFEKEKETFACLSLEDQAEKCVKLLFANSPSSGFRFEVISHMDSNRNVWHACFL
jgi:hypothetical protein